MIKGKSLTQLAAELERRSQEAQDFIVDTKELQFGKRETEGGHTFDLTIPSHGSRIITQHTHGQISQRLGIPKKYYDRLATTQPDLLVDNVQTLFEREPERRMVRTLDGNARAFLSDRYRRIDNEQIFQAAGEALVESGAQVEAVSTDATDQKLYLQVKFPRLEGEVKKGDPVQGGLIITNSEIGSGALEVRPLIYRLVCLNGMVRPVDVENGSVRRNHIGRRVEAGEDFTIYSDETLKADDHALMLKIRDSIRNLSDPQLFFKLMEEMRAAAEGKVIERPVLAVEELAKVITLRDREKELVLENLLRGDTGLGTDLSKWGLLNAVTRVANENEDYDRAVELQEAGGKILTLSDSAWAQIAEAA